MIFLPLQYPSSGTTPTRASQSPTADYATQDEYYTPNLPSYYDNTLDPVTGHYNPDYLHHLTRPWLRLTPYLLHDAYACPALLHIIPYVHSLIIIIIYIRRFHWTTVHESTTTTYTLIHLSLDATLDPVTFRYNHHYWRSINGHTTAPSLRLHSSYSIKCFSVNDINISVNGDNIRFCPSHTTRTRTAYHNYDNAYHYHRNTTHILVVSIPYLRSDTVNTFQYWQLVSPTTTVDPSTTRHQNTSFHHPGKYNTAHLRSTKCVSFKTTRANTPLRTRARTPVDVPLRILLRPLHTQHQPNAASTSTPSGALSQTSTLPRTRRQYHTTTCHVPNAIQTRRLPTFQYKIYWWKIN